MAVTVSGPFSGTSGGATRSLNGKLTVWVRVCQAGMMNQLLVGYARVSTEHQDLTAQRNSLAARGVGDDRIYVDHGLDWYQPGSAWPTARSRGVP